MTDEPAEVLLVTGDDHLDDPAWGAGPIRSGPLSEIMAWLRDEEFVGHYMVSVNGAPAVWAAELLGTAH